MNLNTKIYTYAGVVGNYSRYLLSASGLAQLFSWATGWVNVGRQSGKGKSSPSTVKWRLTVPFAVPAGSACGCEGDVRGEATAYIDINLAATLVTADRTDFALRLKDLVASTEFQSSIINLQQPYA